jgi:TPR repeat protein
MLADAICTLGYLYSTGKFLKQDLELSIKYYSTAAAMDNSDATYSLGVCHSEGTYGEKGERGGKKKKLMMRSGRSE